MKLNSILVLIVGIFLTSIIVGGCGSSSDSSSGPDNILSGTITYSIPSEFNEDCSFYVFLDNDTDITNGYIKRIIISYVSPPSSPFNYEIDTTDVPSGSY